MKPIDVKKLGAMVPIGRGGVGEVLSIPGYRLPGLTELVFKRYLNPMTLIDEENLRGLIDFRDQLDGDDRDLLDEMFLWPLQLVSDGPSLVGYVMLRLDARWLHTFALTTKSKTAPREAKWLVADSASGARIGIQIPPAGADLVRLVLCAKLARAFALLHRDGLVYGDLQPANVIYQLAPSPKVLLVDCDSVKCVAAFKQPNQALWVAPEGGSTPQNEETDCFKLALFILRCLADGKGSAATRDPARASQDGLGDLPGLDDTGINMLAYGLGDDSTRRPTAKQWYSYLRRLLNDLSQPPRIVRVDVSAGLVLTGTRVTVTWEAHGANIVRFETTDGCVLEQDARSNLGTAEISVIRTGTISVTVTNEFGTGRAYSEPIIVFEPPQVNFINIPEPSLPSTYETDRNLIAAVRSALTSQGSTINAPLPQVPTVVSPDPTQVLPSDVVNAVDVIAAKLMNGLPETVDSLTEPIRQLQSALAVPYDGLTGVSQVSETI